MKKFLFALILITLVFGCTQKETNFEKEETLVMRVIDGDTVQLFGGETVRLIGIDSTEKGEECFEEAREKLQELVERKTVLLEKDIEERDKYGRLLAYLYVDNVFVNLKMVEEGFAYAFEFEPTTRYSQDFAIAQKTALKEQKGCLWSNNFKS